MEGEASALLTRLDKLSFCQSFEDELKETPQKHKKKSKNLFHFLKSIMDFVQKKGNGKKKLDVG